MTLKWKACSDRRSHQLIAPDSIYRWVKDYGNHHLPQSEVFSGVRFGSGGPFTNVGRWKTLKGAMKSPAVQRAVEKSVKERMDELRKELSELETYLASITRKSGGR